MIGELH